MVVQVVRRVDGLVVMVMQSGIPWQLDDFSHWLRIEPPEVPK